MDKDKIIKAAMEKKNEFTDFLRLYTTDNDGNRVLRGLTKAETDEYLASRLRRLTGEGSGEDATRWLQLHDKHEAARHLALAAERELRDNPTVN